MRRIEFAGTPGIHEPRTGPLRGAPRERAVGHLQPRRGLLSPPHGPRPYQGDSITELLKRVVHDPVAPPREVNPGVPEELDRICRKMLEKCEADRYQSAAGLVDDLHAWDRAGEGRSEPGPALAGPRGLRRFEAGDAGSSSRCCPARGTGTGCPSRSPSGSGESSRLSPGRSASACSWVPAAGASRRSSRRACSSAGAARGRGGGRCGPGKGRASGSGRGPVGLPWPPGRP